MSTISLFFSFSSISITYNLDKHWSRRSFRVTWTSVTRWCIAWPTVWFEGCSLYRTPLLGLLHERDDRNTSRQCYVSCTGFQTVSEWGSNSPVSCTSHYLVRPLSTWWMMSSFLMTTDDVSFDQLTTEHASFLRHRTVLATVTFVIGEMKTNRY